jgi:methionyl-tRNA formyltransferase
MTAPSYVIASTRPWNRDLATRLAARVDARFTLMATTAELTRAALEQIAPRAVFFPHWSHIIPEDIHGAFECIIFHMTDLPFGRGGSPLQNLLARGFDKTKISALRCEKGLDTGPVYLKHDLSLEGSAEEIFLRADRIIEDMIVEMIETQPPAQPQTGEATLFKRRTPDMSNLKDVKTLDEAYDLIRMLDADGYPRAFLDVGPLRLEFSRTTRKAGGLAANVSITAKEIKE